MDKECKDIFYLYLQSKVSEPAFEKRGDGTMSVAEATYRLFQWKIPNVLKPVVIKIWENMGIVERIDRRTLKFKKVDFDISNIGSIYDKLGLFPNE